MPGDPESRGRLLATIGDPRKNLKSSYDRWVAEGLLTGEYRVDAIVIACARDISGTKRKGIETFCRDHGLPTPMIFGRDWFVIALAKDPNWRVELTSVQGRLEALTPIRPPSLAPELHGRALELQELDAARGHDVVLYGLPGVGKTRLIQDLENAHQAVPEASSYLVDDLHAFVPTTVVIDDAHLQIDLLADLIRARAQEQLTFDIVAISWPADAERIKTRLKDAAVLEVPQLPRDVMDRIVRNAGVTGIRARHIVLRQAEGRPGWALTLCTAIVAGDGATVVTGDVLLEKAQTYLRQVSQSDQVLDALAIVSAIQGADTDDIAEIASLVASPLVDLVERLNQLATAGLIEQRNGRWMLQSTLGAPLVARWFFGQRKVRSWDAIREAFPGRHEDLTQSLLTSAQATGASDVLATVAEWAASLPEPEAWDVQTIGLVSAYAMLGLDQCAFAAAAGKRILQFDREPIQDPWGTGHDLVADAAVRLLRACVERSFDPTAVGEMLTLALSDTRQTFNTTSHPLRIIGDLVRSIQPDGATLFALRGQLVNITTAWLAADENSDEHWAVAAKAMTTALDPNIEGSWNDPGAPMTLSLTSGVEPASRLQELIALWQTLNADLLVTVVGTIPTVALKSLVNLFDTWLRLSAGHAKGNVEVPTDIRTIAFNGSWQILDDLFPHINNDPGSALLVQKSLNLAARWQIDIPDWVRQPDVDRDLQLLASVRDSEATAEEWMARRKAEAEELGDRLLGLGPAAGTARFQQLLTEAGDQANAGWATALRIADSTHELPEWIDATLDAAEPMLLGPLLRRAVQSGTAFDADAAETALRDQRLRSTIVGSALHATSLSDFVRRVVGELVDVDTPNLENLYSREEPDEVLLALLEHPVAAIRHATALLFDVGTGHGPPLPDEWRELWRVALVEPDPTHLTQHSEWRLQEILKALATRDPDTCAAWFEARFEELGATNWFIRDDDLRDALTLLPRPTRARLVPKVVSNYANRRTFLPALVNGDPSLLKELIDDGTLDQQAATDALEGLSRPHSAVIAEALLRAGASPNDVASALFREDTWWGEESDHYATQISELERMVADHPLLDPVTAIAISQLISGREEALIRERRRSITGNFD